MRFERFVGFATSGLLGLGMLGCSGASDPVADSVEASNKSVTVAPEASQGPEGAIKAQQDFEKKQLQADRAAGRR